jgi:hypothetical protein
MLQIFLASLIVVTFFNFSTSKTLAHYSDGIPECGMGSNPACEEDENGQWVLVDKKIVRICIRIRPSGNKKVIWQCYYKVVDKNI